MGDGGDGAALFAFEDVSVTGDGGEPILRGVTATIPDRGITCLLGPSGAGKSTLLRLCNRLEVPAAGVVRYRGGNLLDRDPLALRRDVGMVFQRPTVFPGTVRDNLLVAAPGATGDRLRRLLELVGLDPGFLDREADELSGGEAQRVCVARSLITDPQALLADEPTSALDPAARRGIEAVARRLADEAVPIVWVTHDLDQAERVADRVLVIVDGRVAAAGTMGEVGACADPDVQAFLAGGAQPDGPGPADPEGESDEEDRG